MPDLKFNYQMLARLKMDCDYFLGAGNRHEKHLWGLNVENHIAEMRKQYQVVPEKPEWLTAEQIEEYANQMRSVCSS